MSDGSTTFGQKVKSGFILVAIALLALTIGPKVVHTVDGVWDELAKPPTGDDDNGRRRIELIAKGSEPNIWVRGSARGSQSGVLWREDQVVKKPEPFVAEFWVNKGESVLVNFLVWSKGPPEAGQKVMARCEVHVNGENVKQDRDEFVISDPDHRNAYAECIWGG